MPCPLIQEIETRHTPESLIERLHAETGTILLRSGTIEHGERFSLVAARPFLRFESYGSRCEIESAAGRHTLFGSPWKLLESLANRYELLEEIDLPFPLGGCFGYFGYELKQFVEPHLPLTTRNDLELPECSVGFYDSLVAFDHKIEKAWLISTGLGEEGDRSDERAQAAAEFWLGQLGTLGQAPAAEPPLAQATMPQVTSTMSRESYCDGVRRIINYIWRGDIYQANLTHRLAAEVGVDGWMLFQRLATASPAPFSAFMQCGDFQLASSSPEQFLRLSGDHVTTRPIKGTRPRGTSPDLDARLGYELQTSAKDRSELVMITDLLRNDLGRFCEYGSVTVPELAKLERFAQVQHLVSTVAGRLRPSVTHLHALASCFPGGSITGAPKIRAMEIIDELEPVVRGPYTGCLGYLGFNRESQFNILIRTAICRDGTAWFHVGAGIVADSDPAAEYDETLNKAAGWLAALNLSPSALPLSPAMQSPNIRT
jgi:para-aminobenzoate synthetase component 1